MGTALSTAVQTAQQQALDNEKATASELNNLSTILTAKANEYFTKLVNAKGEDKTIPIKTLIEYKKHVSASVANGPSDKLNDAIEELFGGNFMSSLKAMALGAIDAVLGNTSAGAKEETGYKVLVMYNTVVRVDYYVYGYNLYTQTGLMDRSRNGLAFVATVGVVDMKQVGLEALVYLVGAQANAARMFMNTRYNDFANRQRAIAAFSPILDQTPLPASIDSIKVLEKLKGAVTLETLLEYLADVESEVDASANEDDSLTPPVPLSGLDLKAEETRVKAVNAYNEEKTKQIDAHKTNNSQPTKQEEQTLLNLYVDAWKAVAARLIPGLTKVQDDHKKIMFDMKKEQKDILEGMKEIYLQAKAITTAIQGA